MYVKQNVGIDIAKDKFDVSLNAITSEIEKRKLGARAFKNTLTGWDELKPWVEKKKIQEIPLAFTMEYTGVYYQNLACYLQENGYTVCMVAASACHKYLRSLPWSSKTDGLDPLGISWMGLERKLTIWEPISTEYQYIRDLIRERAELLKIRTATKNRVHAKNASHTYLKTTQKRQKYLSDVVDLQIKSIEKEITKIVKSDSKIQRQVEVVTSIPSIGLISAVTVLAETDGFAHTKSIKQVTSYAGYDVKLNDSGNVTGKSKISKQGNAHIRRVLHMPSLTAGGQGQIYFDLRNRIEKKKGKYLVASVAVQRKLLALMYTLCKNDVLYDPNYKSNIQMNENTNIKNSKNTVENLEENNKGETQKVDVKEKSRAA